MKNALYIFLPVAAVALIVGMVLMWGLNPRPVGVMKPSFFDAPEELGAVLYRRFFVELENSPVIVWGLDPGQPEQAEVLAGFLSAYTLGGKELSEVIVDEELTWSGELPFALTEVMDFQNQYTQLKERLKAASSERAILLVTRFAFSSQKVTMDTMTKSLKRDLEMPIFSVTHLHLALTAQQEEDLRPQCQAIGDKGLGELGCLALAKSRSIYRKAPKFQDEKWVAVMDRWPGNDVFIYWAFKASGSTSLLFQDQGQSQFVGQGPAPRPEVSSW